MRFEPHQLTQRGGEAHAYHRATAGVKPFLGTRKLGALSRNRLAQCCAEPAKPRPECDLNCLTETVWSEPLFGALVMWDTESGYLKTMHLNWYSVGGKLNRVPSVPLAPLAI